MSALPWMLRDVVALDALGQPGQAQRLLHLGHRGVEGALPRQPLRPRHAEPLRRVLGHHRDEAALLPAHGHLQLHVRAAAARQPLGQQGRVVRRVLDEDGGRDVGRAVVELLDEGGEDAALLLVLDAVHDEVIAPDELAVADEERLHPRLVALLRHGDDVRVLVAQRHDLLVLADALDGLHLVAEAGGALELEALGSLVHAVVQLPHDVRRLALEEHEHLLDDLHVVAAVRIADARRDAAVDVVLEAGARVRAGDGLGAGAVGEQLLQQREGLPHRARAGEGAKVAGAVVQDAAGEVDLRELLAGVDLDVRVGLVVAEARVEGRAVPLDERVFEDERLALRVRDDELEVVGLLHHAADLGHEAEGRPEVRAQPVAQVGRLADVDELAGGVLEEVDARPRGHGTQAVAHGAVRLRGGLCRVDHGVIVRHACEGRPHPNLPPQAGEGA